MHRRCEVFRKDPKANAPPSKSDASLVTNFGKKTKPREQTKKNTEDAMGGKKVRMFYHRVCAVAF